MRMKLLVALAAAAALAGCGSDDPEPAAEETQAAAGADLGAIKDYLLTHTASLREHTAALAADAEAYHAAAERAGFDYRRLLAGRRDGVARLVARMQATF